MKLPRKRNITKRTKKIKGENDDIQKKLTPDDDDDEERKKRTECESVTTSQPGNIRQIIWDHKACIQQYLQRVMNITSAVTVTFFMA